LTRFKRKAVQDVQVIQDRNFKLQFFVFHLELLVFFNLFGSCLRLFVLCVGYI